MSRECEDGVDDGNEVCSSKHIKNESAARHKSMLECLFVMIKEPQDAEVEGEKEEP